MDRRKRLCYMVFLTVFIFALLLPLISVNASSSTVTFEPTEDARVWSSYPNNNYGSANELSVGSDSETYIKFDLSSIPSGSVIISATLKLYQYNSVSGVEICVHRVTGSWSESSITWNNKPSYDSQSEACSDSAGQYQWTEWDITDLVQGWVDGSYDNHGLVLVSSGDMVQFYSREWSEADKRPKLTVEYVEPNTVTTTIANTTITETVTTTQTINNTVTETVTTTVANTTYYTTVYETVSPTYGNQTANYYTDLANQLMPLVMVIGVICTMLSLLLSATKGR